MEGFAKARLAALKRYVENTGKDRATKLLPLNDVEIFLKTGVDCEDEIRITARGPEFLIVCYAGATTGDYSVKDRKSVV